MRRGSDAPSFPSPLRFLACSAQISRLLLFLPSFLLNFVLLILAIRFISLFLSHHPSRQAERSPFGDVERS